MKQSRKHAASVILNGQRKHNTPGDLPRATGFNFNPTHTNHELNSSEILGVYRDGEWPFLKLVIDLGDGMFDVRLRAGADKKWKLKEHADLITECIDGFSKFKDDFTMKETEFYVLSLMEQSEPLQYWDDGKHNRIVIPTDLNNRPTEEYLNGHSLNIDTTPDPVEQVEYMLSKNKNYLNSMHVSKSAIERLEAKGYLDQELLNKLDNTDNWKKIQEFIKNDKETSKKRKREIKEVKGDKVRLKSRLAIYFPEMGRFEVRESTKTFYYWWDLLKIFPQVYLNHKILYIWDKDNKRIYHSLF